MECEVKISEFEILKKYFFWQEIYREKENSFEKTKDLNNCLQCGGCGCGGGGNCGGCGGCGGCGSGEGGLGGCGGCSSCGGSCGSGCTG